MGIQDKISASLALKSVLYILVMVSLISLIIHVFMKDLFILMPDYDLTSVFFMVTAGAVGWFFPLYLLTGGQFHKNPEETTSLKHLPTLAITLLVLGLFALFLYWLPINFDLESSLLTVVVGFFVTFLPSLLKQKLTTSSD